MTYQVPGTVLKAGDKNRTKNIWKDWESLLRAIYNIQLYLLCAFIRWQIQDSVGYFFFARGVWYLGFTYYFDIY